MKNKLLTAIIIPFGLFTANAQISTVKPEKPSLKDPVTLTYKCSDTGAVLHGKNPVFARITTYLDDGSVEKFHIRMTGNTMLSGTFKLPEHAASFKTEFYTLNKDDDGAAHTALVYNDDHTRPVRGAYLEALFDDKPDSIFQKEILNYPDNYLAYAHLINIVSMVKDRDAAQTQIKDLLVMLKNKEQAMDKANPGFLAALCVGNSKTGNFAEGKKDLFELFSRFPKSREAQFAFSLYTYEVYKSTGSYKLEPDVYEKVKEILVEYPGSAISKDENVFSFLYEDQSIPVEAFEKVIKPLYVNDQVNYSALTHLPELYITRKIKLDSAEALLDAAIRRYEDGTINHQYRLNNGHYQRYVPFMYLDLAKLYMIKNSYKDAVSSVSAAIAIMKGSNIEGIIYPLLLQIRATAYQSAGNLNLAMDDYKQLYRNGNAAALDSMRNLFPLCSLKQKTFREFEASLKPDNIEKSPRTIDAAPDFTATDMKGNRVHLSDYKGKLVAINIWGTGCGPCIAEMPELNKLVKEYANRPDVVFLAVSGDKTESLVKFFRHYKFDYRILNNAGNIYEKFNVSGMPVHIVINKNGEIVSRSIGAMPDIKEYLRRIIDSNI